ncbi:hypothetical protein D6783_00570 [Candidatus Woesearchaeota archaeon]|nr:MAG: hypothetical protein D6783_00570 [Candidatus Woesearchaeota archaeon]
MRELFVFGNEWVERDSGAYCVVKELEKRGVLCTHVKDPQELLPRLERGDRVVILDVAEGVEEPVVVERLDLLETGRVSSLHDFDLAFFLKLLKEVGVVKEEQVTIVAVPVSGRVAVNDIVALLKKV